jgi:hypothetical protein
MIQNDIGKIFVCFHARFSTYSNGQCLKSISNKLKLVQIRRSQFIFKCIHVCCPLKVRCVPITMAIIYIIFFLSLSSLSPQDTPNKSDRLLVNQNRTMQHKYCFFKIFFLVCHIWLPLFPFFIEYVIASIAYIHPVYGRIRTHDLLDVSLLP